jgi:MFS family permease
VYGIKFGRRNSIILGNTALCIISALSIIENYYSILVLRFFFGVFAGFVLPQAPKVIVETVPANLIDYGFGAITNGFTFLMIAIDEALSLLNQKKSP